jgi:hypothetical protein
MNGWWCFLPSHVNGHGPLASSLDCSRRYPSSCKQWARRCLHRPPWRSLTCTSRCLYRGPDAIYLFADGLCLGRVGSFHGFNLRLSRCGGSLGLWSPLPEFGFELMTVSAR